MDMAEVALQLEALGNHTRLAIYRYLVKEGSGGCPVGEIRTQLDIPASTLSHHITKLVNAGLLGQERQSRSLLCTVNHESMDTLVAYLVENCCSGDWVIQDE